MITEQITRNTLVTLNIIFASISVISVAMSQDNGQILYSIPGVVLISEFLKLFFTLIISLFSFILDPNSFMIEIPREDEPIYEISEFQQLSFKIRKFFIDSFQYIIPALFYSISNNLIYVVLQFLTPPSYQLLLNARIMLTAFLLKFMMDKKLTFTQYASLLLLMCSIALSRLKLQTNFVSTDAKFVLGVLIMLIIIFSMSLANVSMEMALKKTFQTSIYLQNFYLYAYGVIINIIIYVIRALVFQEPILDPFHHYNFHTIISIVSSVFLSIIVTGVLKYADNIIHLFASAASVVCVTILNAIFLSGRITPHFVLSTIIVFASIYSYMMEDSMDTEIKEVNQVELQEIDLIKYEQVIQEESDIKEEIEIEHLEKSIEIEQNSKELQNDKDEEKF